MQGFWLVEIRVVVTDTALVVPLLSHVVACKIDAHFLTMLLVVLYLLKYHFLQVVGTLDGRGVRILVHRPRLFEILMRRAEETQVTCSLDHVGPLLETCINSLGLLMLNGWFLY